MLVIKFMKLCETSQSRRITCIIQNICAKKYKNVLLTRFLSCKWIYTFVAQGKREYFDFQILIARNVILLPGQV